ncbi:MAG TPA: hypothetical protein VGH15_14790 [Caulobacteraceae bacterium]
MKIRTLLALGAVTISLGMPMAGGALGQTAQMRANHAEAVQDQIQSRVARRNHRRINHVKMVQRQISTRVARRDHRRINHVKMVQHQIDTRVDRRADRPD